MIAAVPRCMDEATPVVPLSIYIPSPDIQFLNLCAARRRTHRRARRTRMACHWQNYRRVTAVLRRHTLRLRRGQRRQFCSSLSAHSPIANIWNVLQGISAAFIPHDTFSVLSFGTGISMLNHAD